MQRIKENTSSVGTTLGSSLFNTDGDVIYTPPSEGGDCNEYAITVKKSNFSTYTMYSI